MNSSSESATFIRRLIAHRSARWALVVIAGFVVTAIVGPWLVAHSGIDQPDIVGLKNRPPSLQHIFGTDQFSRDVFARVLSGARISLAVSTLAMLISMTIGTTYGLVAGYAGGRVESVMMRVLDAFLAIPRILLLIAALTLWRPELAGLILLIGGTGWFGVSRLVRAQTRSARHTDYVEAARALGVSDMRILWRHILPNVAAPVIVTATLAVGNVIALEAGLSYLGIGVRPPTASWGSMFTEGAASYGAWWTVFFPGVAIVGTVLAFNVLGDALRDVLDPRQLHRAEPVSISADAQLVENG